MAKPKKSPATRIVESITHQGKRRIAIPTQDLQTKVSEDTKKPVILALKKRRLGLDPQLVWRGKYDERAYDDGKENAYWNADNEDLKVPAPALYIQEKIHPRAILEDLIAETKERKHETPGETPELFGDFNGVPDGADKADFYKHDLNWTNRMISGDSLQVMASLAARERLAGGVQCIYMDPPYGIQYGSNFQTSTDSNKPGSKIRTKEPEMIKAYQDTWSDTIHSYLTYLWDRFSVAKELLHESGSIFVQIGDENVHLVRALLDEVFRRENFEAQITYVSSSGLERDGVKKVTNYLLWYCKNKKMRKFRPFFLDKTVEDYGYVELGNGERMSLADFEKRFGHKFDYKHPEKGSRLFYPDKTTSQGGRTDPSFVFNGRKFTPDGNWKPGFENMEVLAKANRLYETEGGRTLKYVRYFDDFPGKALTNVWTKVGSEKKKVYVVQTATEIIKRCILMCTDPGDLVLDPTCGSGTTAYVAEEWGRRWITIDTSRVALALARTRLMCAKYPWYLLADSVKGRKEETQISGQVFDDSTPVSNNIRYGFVYKRAQHLKLNMISNNKEIKPIYEKYQDDLEQLRKKLNAELNKSWEEWEIPRAEDRSWSAEAKRLHEELWEKRLKRQREIDKAIAGSAEIEIFYNKPLEDNKIVRVAGPFTVESTSEHRVLALDPDNNVVENESGLFDRILEIARKYGVRQHANKEDRIYFDSIKKFPGKYIGAIGEYTDGKGNARKAGILVGPEFGSISKSLLVAASKEAEESGFAALISFGFNYEALSTDLGDDAPGKVAIIMAKMSDEIRMKELKGGNNLLVSFGNPDIEITPDSDDPAKIVVEIRGVDVFAPNNGKIRSSETDDIACWFIDTDYNGESFFARHAYFCGSYKNDPYAQLKKSLNTEIDATAWHSLHKTKSRPFRRPKSGRIAIKVISGYGDEVMKIFNVPK